MAREAYFKIITSKHSNLIVSNRGLVIHPKYPHLGASPDGYVNCSCCGPGVIEVKCPFSCSNQSFLEATNDTNFCLECTGDGQFSLKRSHSYFIKCSYR